MGVTLWQAAKIKLIKTTELVDRRGFRGKTVGMTAPPTWGQARATRGATQKWSSLTIGFGF